MRILLACEFYYPSVGGVQEVMRQLAERLVERGHRVTVATTRLPERTSRKLNGVRIVEFDVSGNMVWGLNGDVEGYRRYVTSCDFDVFMVKAAQQWTIDALIPVLDRITKPKVFIPCGFSGFYEPAYAEYFRQMPDWLRKFDQLIFYASDYRDINFARQHGIDKLTVIPNGASEREFGVQPDRGFRARNGIPEDAFVLLTVGTLTGLKGHLELAKAFDQCDFGARRAVLLLNGNTPRSVSLAGVRGWGRFIRQRRAIVVDGYRRYGAVAVAKWIARSVLLRLNLDWAVRTPGVYRMHGGLRATKWITRSILLDLRLGWVLGAFGYNTQRYGVDERPDGVGDVVARINSANGHRRAMLVDFPRPELVQAYRNSDLFVFASKVEYSPLVLYEAAAAGLPFLSASVGNAKEIAEWTGAGIVFDAPRDAQGYTQVDPAALAAEIARVAAQTGLLARLGAQGRSNWEARFTWDKIAHLYERVFEQCVAEAGGLSAAAPPLTIGRAISGSGGTLS